MDRGMRLLLQEAPGGAPGVSSDIDQCYECNGETYCCANEDYLKDWAWRREPYCDSSCNCECTIEIKVWAYVLMSAIFLLVVCSCWICCTVCSEMRVRREQGAGYADLPTVLKGFENVPEVASVRMRRNPPHPHAPQPPPSAPLLPFSVPPIELPPHAAPGVPVLSDWLKYLSKDDAEVVLRHRECAGQELRKSLGLMRWPGRGWQVAPCAPFGLATELKQYSQLQHKLDGDGGDLRFSREEAFSMVCKAPKDAAGYTTRYKDRKSSVESDGSSVPTTAEVSNRKAGQASVRQPNDDAAALESSLAKEETIEQDPTGPNDVERTKSAEDAKHEEGDSEDVPEKDHHEDSDSANSSDAKRESAAGATTSEMEPGANEDNKGKGEMKKEQAVEAPRKWWQWGFSAPPKSPPPKTVQTRSWFGWGRKPDPQATTSGTNQHNQAAETSPSAQDRKSIEKESESRNSNQEGNAGDQEAKIEQNNDEEANKGTTEAKAEGGESSSKEPKTAVDSNATPTGFFSRFTSRARNQPEPKPPSTSAETTGVFSWISGVFTRGTQQKKYGAADEPESNDKNEVENQNTSTDDNNDKDDDNDNDSKKDETSRKQSDESKGSGGEKSPDERIPSDLEVNTATGESSQVQSNPVTEAIPTEEETPSPVPENTAVSPETSKPDSSALAGVEVKDEVEAAHEQDASHPGADSAAIPQGLAQADNGVENQSIDEPPAVSPTEGSDAKPPAPTPLAPMSAPTTAPLGGSLPPLDPMIGGKRFAPLGGTPLPALMKAPAGPLAGPPAGPP
mmetsp:Transcript_4699/g.8840  ORF Transcript_4699/g.8840 Transcript_4699/m.8840 type:complete len:791 (+) Transcript_4699:162-2534(+)